MKILVTGGAGYIGTELVNLLANNKDVDEIVVYDNLSRANHNFFMGFRERNLGKIRFVNGDILDSRKIKMVIKDVDVIYHLAAKVTTPFGNDDPHLYEQINHWGTAELVYAVEESNVKKFIYVSSTSVYGSSKSYIDENSQLNPRTFYGISKMRGEEHVKRLFEKIDTYIIRCGNVYGYSKSMRFDAVINHFMFQANFNHRISIHGNGKQGRAFIHVDLISNVLRSLGISNIPSGIYNVVDKNFQILEIVDVLKELYPDLEFIFINQHLELRELNVDINSKLRQYLDYTNERNLKAELEEFRIKFAF